MVVNTELLLTIIMKRENGEKFTLTPTSQLKNYLSTLSKGQDIYIEIVNK